MSFGAKAVRVVITGRVQGVWFRGWIMDEACRRGLSGWVRNRRDGSVEALFSGPERMVDDMVSACLHGPSYAKVDDVDSNPAAPPREDGFHTLTTK